MMKKTLLFAILSTFVVACAIQPTPDTVDTAECGDGVCNGDEDGDSCPSDCSDDSPICGDNVCESPENADNCSADCGDNPDPTNKGVAWSGGSDLLIINGDICPGTNSEADVVGECLATNSTGWVAEDASKRTVYRDADGNYPVVLDGPAGECMVTLHRCRVIENLCPGGADWSNQGCNPAFRPGTGNGGPFLGFVEGEGAPIKFFHRPGEDPEPRGILPNGP